MKFVKKPVSKTFTALPTSWLWPAGPPIWQISTLGAAVALTSVAVPALPTVLPDKTPSAPSTRAAIQDSDGDGDDDVPGSGTVAGTTSTPSATDPTAVPTVTEITPTRKAHKSAAPGTTGTATPETTSTATGTGTPTQAPATTEDTEPVSDPVTIAATDSNNERWLVTATTCATCVSGSRIIGIGLLATLTVPVDADTAGTRTLTVAYESKRQRDLYISVNGGASQKVTVPALGDWETPGWTSVTVELDPGENSIKFHNPVGLAPDIDQITVE